MPYFFDGQLHISPGAFSSVNDSALLPKGLSAGNVLAVVGQADDGPPNTAVVCQSPADALAILAGGKLYSAVKRAFSPSPETGGPDKIIFVRVDPAVQGALQLRDSLAAVVITLASNSYGLRGNQVKVKIEAATGGRGLKITTQRGNDFYSGDNIFRNAFSVQYTGGQASGVMTINGSQAVLQAPSGTTVATIDLNTFSTVQKLVDNINAVAGFVATVLDGNGDTPTLQALDFVTSQDVKTALYTAKADLQAAVDWFNSGAEGFVNATRATDVGTLPAVAGFTYLAGGSNGNTTNTEWANAFSTLQTVDFQWLAVASTSASIHAMADAHVQFMSKQGRKERRAIVGCALGTTDVAALALAKALNSDRTGYVHLGGYDYDSNGVLTLYDPSIVAAMVAGGFAGLPPGSAMTNKALNLRGVERNLRNPADTDALLLGGIIPIENTPTGFRVVQSISTWLTNAKFNRRELSCGAALDYTNRTVRDALQAAIVGNDGAPITLGLAVNIAKTELTALSVPKSSGGPGVLVGDAANPPFKDVSAQLIGDAITVFYQCSPVIPVNYVGAQVSAVPFSGTASA